jgi:hypothetical protein
MTCIYIKECNVEKRPICEGVYERCIIYSRRRILDRNKTKTGLERFVDKYPDYNKMFIGSKK